MSTTPPIQSSGPVISPDVPWETRRHLQLLYQKLGNHTRAFSHVVNQINTLKPGSTTNNITVDQNVISGGGGGSSEFLGQGLVNDQTGATSYATHPGDNGILLILNDASPVAVTLTTDAAPFYLIITNFGAGTATLTPSTGTINGGASLPLLQNQTVLVSCDSTNWHTTAILVPPQNTPAVAHEWLNSYNAATGAFGQTQPAYSDISGTPVLPANTPSTTHQFFTAYNAATGAFTAAQPTYSDISGTPTLPSNAPATASKWVNSYTASTGVFTETQPAFTDISGTATAAQVPALSALSGQITTSQLPASGLSVTITTAKLTVGGANGSMTFVNGILTASTPAT
jgi:hypothetical protein